MVMKRRAGWKRFGWLNVLWIVFFGWSGVMRGETAGELKNKKPNVAFYSVESTLSQVTRVSIVFPFGSVQDPDDKQGITSMTLSLLLKGAKRLTSRQISDQLALFGAAVDFSVTRHYSILQINVLSQYLKPCLEFVARVLMTPTFPKREFDLLKAQYVADIKANLESNRRLLWRAYQRWYYAKAPGNHLSGGMLKSIKALKLSDVMAWRNRVFRVPGVSVFYVTDLERKGVEAVLSRNLGFVTAGPPLRPVTSDVVNKPKGIEVVVIEKPDTKTSDFMFVQPGLSFKMDKAVFFADVLGNEAFGSGMQSRLFIELRDKRGWTYHASSGYWGGLYRDFNTPWVMYAFPSLQYTKEAVELAYDLMKGYFKEGITKEELSLYRTSMIRSYPFRVATPSQMLDKRFDEVVLGRYPMAQKEREQLLKSLTLKTIREAVKRVHDHDKGVFLIVGEHKSLKEWLPKVFGRAFKSPIRVIKPEDVL